MPMNHFDCDRSPCNGNPPLPVFSLQLLGQKVSETLTTKGKMLSHLCQVFRLVCATSYKDYLLNFWIKLFGSGSTLMDQSFWHITKSYKTAHNQKGYFYYSASYALILLYSFSSLQHAFMSEFMWVTGILNWHL